MVKEQLFIKKDCYLDGNEIYESAYGLLDKLGYIGKMESFKSDVDVITKIIESENLTILICFVNILQDQKCIEFALENMNKIHKQRIYGIIITPVKVMVVNSQIGLSNSKNGLESSKIIFESEHDKRIERFLNILSYQSMFFTNNMEYFKDIADYRNVGFKGKKSSWPSYESTLYNFFLYYSEKKSSYRENIYEIITADDYIDFVQDVSMASSRALKSPHTLCNKYSYLKGFILYKAPRNKEFKKSRKEIEEAVDDLEDKKVKEIVLNDEQIQMIISYFKTHKNSVRNQCIFYLLLFYGMERKKLAALKWSDFDFDKEEILVGNKRPIPDILIDFLKQLEKENTNNGFPHDYLFYIKRKGKHERLKDTSINEIFRRITVQLDGKAKYSPQYIRKGMVRYWLENKKCNLEDIIFWFDIDLENLENYITNEEIHRIVMNRNCKHPLG